MSSSLGPLDLWLIGLYVAFLVVVAVRVLRGARRDAVDFLLAGRGLTLPTFVATLVSTWYGGILGVGEYAWRYGIANWLVFGVPYYLAAILSALLLARKARRTGLFTIPDKLYGEYGRGGGMVGTIIVLLMTSPAPYVLMLAVLLQILLGWPLLLSLVVGAAFSALYVAIGGFRSVVKTDFLQFALMFGAFMIILPIACWRYGGLEFLRSATPRTHFVWHGGNPPQAIFVWYVIALQTLVAPSFYQRCYAARDERVARRGILISVLFWIFFDFLTTSTGLYARALLPDLQDPVRAFPELAVLILQPVARGLFFVGLFATIMSPPDPYPFLSALTSSRARVSRWTEGRVGQRRWPGRGRMLASRGSVLLAYFRPSVVDLWYNVGSIATPALLLPLGISFSSRWRLDRRFALAAMAAAAVLATAGVGVHLSGWAPPAPLGFLARFEAIYPALGVSVLICAAGLRAREAEEALEAADGGAGR